MKNLVALSLLLAAPLAAAQPLTLHTEENRPFNYTEGGAVKGVAADAVRELLKNAGVEGTIKVGPWDAGYSATQANANACIFSAARNENREKLFRWFGPVAQNTWALYSLPTFDKKIATTRDARFFKIGSVKNDAKVDYLRAEGASSIKEAATDAENPARLALPRDNPNHIDLWITSGATARDMAGAAGVKEIKEVLVVRKQDLYLACNPRTAKPTLDKLQAAVKK